MGGGEPFSALALTVWECRCFEDILTKDDSLHCNPIIAAGAKEYLEFFFIAKYDNI